MMDVFEEIEHERQAAVMAASSGPVKRSTYQRVQGALSASTAYYRAALATDTPEVEIALLGELRTALELVQEQIAERRHMLALCLDAQGDYAIERRERAAEALEGQARPFSGFTEVG